MDWQSSWLPAQPHWQRHASPQVSAGGLEGATQLLAAHNQHKEVHSARKNDRFGPDKEVEKR